MSLLSTHYTQCNIMMVNVVLCFVGTPRLTGTGMVRVLISDDNDCDPTFDQERYEFTVSENSVQGTSVAKVDASDADDGLNAKLR